MGLAWIGRRPRGAFSGSRPARKIGMSGRVCTVPGRGALALCALGGFFAAACEPEPARVAEGTASDLVQAVEGMTLRESQEGKLRWVLNADTARVHEKDDLTILLGVQVDFYDAEGESISSTLTAREGQVDARTRGLIARREVVVLSREGHRLETEELRWDPELGKVVSERFVRLTKGGSVLTGIGIETDPELRSYAIRSEVEGHLREEDKVDDL
ncbi:MAG: LPS export ABC transporter periplasmic protein LptC [Candidatus Eisenbacteria bacterium]